MACARTGHGMCVQILPMLIFEIVEPSKPSGGDVVFENRLVEFKSHLLTIGAE